MSALTLLLQLRGKGQGPAAIGRELALDLAEGLYRPDVGEHVPGIANAGPDLLSRMSEPGKTVKLPTYLLNARRISPPCRDTAFWRAASLPAVAAESGTGGDWTAGEGN